MSLNFTKSYKNIMPVEENLDCRRKGVPVHNLDIPCSGISLMIRRHPVNFPGYFHCSTGYSGSSEITSPWFKLGLRPR